MESLKQDLAPGNTGIISLAGGVQVLLPLTFSQIAKL